MNKDSQTSWVIQRHCILIFYLAHFMAGYSGKSAIFVIQRQTSHVATRFIPDIRNEWGLE